MKGQITLEKIRPDGFEFPIGLNLALSNTVVDYLVVAGGGGGGADRGGAGGVGVTCTGTERGDGGAGLSSTLSGAPVVYAGGGGGSGGGSGPSLLGSIGGKGIVVVRYAGGQAATGGTVTFSSAGYTIHTFTGDGTFATNSDFRIANVSSYSIN